MGNDYLSERMGDLIDQIKNNTEVTRDLVNSQREFGNILHALDRRITVIETERKTEKDTASKLYSKRVAVLAACWSAFVTASIAVFQYLVSLFRVGIHHH